MCSRVASTAKTTGWCELTHPRQAAQSPSVVAVRLVHVRAWAGPFTRILKRVPGKICHDERDTQKYEVERPVPLPMRQLVPPENFVVVVDVLRDVRQHGQRDTEADGVRKFLRAAKVLARDAQERCEQERPASGAEERGYRDEQRCGGRAA